MNVLLEHSHTYLSACCGCFHITTAELSSEKDPTAHKARNFTVYPRKEVCQLLIYDIKSNLKTMFNLKLRWTEWHDLWGLLIPAFKSADVTGQILVLPKGQLGFLWFPGLGKHILKSVKSCLPQTTYANGKIKYLCWRSLFRVLLRFKCRLSPNPQLVRNLSQFLAIFSSIKLTLWLPGARYLVIPL